MALNATLPKDAAVQIGISFFEELTAKCSSRNFRVRFWDGSLWGAAEDPQFTLVLNHPAALRRMFSSPSELTLGEAFIFGDFDIEGDMESAFEFSDRLIAQDISLPQKLRLTSKLLELPNRTYSIDGTRIVELTGKPHSKQRDRSAISYHYDVSNEFLSLFLDKEMVYSCGYFRSPEDDLETAQANKLDYLCRKLRLEPGQRLLDLGCGWGGLLMHAARYYGVKSFGITLSVQQAELARERIRQAGLSDLCKVEICDYRDVDTSRQFDKVVSVGMFEHVGESLLPDYFRIAWDLLRPGGVFLNHGIAVSATYRRKGPSFIDKYVFPDGELVPLHATIRSAESCGFEVRDIESLREHYAMTLRHWVRRLEANAKEAQRLTDDVTYRIWRIYMSGSAHAFQTGRTNLYQILFSKPERGNSNLPLTRQDWYS